MCFRRQALFAMLLCAAPALLSAQSAEEADASLFLELNNAQNDGDACRLTFLVRNETGISIDQAVFETVIFDTAGGVVNLSLFDFRDLPAQRPRVRQFQLPKMTCEAVGRMLINGANTCVVNGSENTICDEGLSLSSRLSVELLG